MDSEPLTITAAAPLIRDGQLTPSDLLEQCLARIDRYEEKVRAWVYLDRERARTEAAQLTDEIKKGHYRGPLHGIPVGIKDIIDVFDMPTGCGSKLWANSYARRDATCVQRLREAGALILGKTVTTPYAFLDPPPTRNPWNLDRTPGGSSSGSAAAVACGMCLAALGTQTGGSITRPASFCGVCSLKPTYGRVSVEGVLPLAKDLDHVGVMARGVRDLIPLYEAIGKYGYEIRNKDYISPLEPKWSDEHADLQPQIGRLRGVFDETTDPAVLSVIDTACKGISDKIWLEDVRLPPSFSSVIPAHRKLMAVQAAAVHRDRLARHPDDYPTKIRELVEEGMQYSAVDYNAAWQDQQEFPRQFNGYFQWYKALLTPATRTTAPTPETTGDPAFNSPWSYSGYPTVSLSVGRTDDGLPVAVQLVGGHRNEYDLLFIAAWMEQQLGPLYPLLPE